MRWRGFALAVGGCALLAGCSPERTGPLLPVEQAGVTIVDVRAAKDAARIARGALTAVVSGQWSSPGLQYLDVRYVNAGGTPVMLDLTGFRLSRDGEEARLSRVSDTTGVDVSDANPSNDELRDIPGAAQGAFKLSPGEARTLQVTFDAFQQDEPLAKGCRLRAEVPVAGGAPVELELRCG